MNAVRNALYLILGFVMLIGIGLSFTIGNQLIDATYVSVFPNSHLVNVAYQDWINVRDFFINMTYNFLVPLIIFLTFASSLIGRNTGLVTYLTQSMVILMLTPILVYSFAEFFTPFLQSGLIDMAYIRVLYFENLLYLLVINMIVSFLSFLFTRRGVSNESYA